MKKDNRLFSIFIVVLLIVGGAFIILRSNSDKSEIKNDYTVSGEPDQKNIDTGAIAGSSSPYLAFNKESYEEALSSGKVVFLNFYADWCPICRAELPAIKNAFNSLTTDQVVGFQVNYNDGSTDQEEKKLAKEFEVTYQHTKVILKNGQKVFGPAIEQWDEKKVLEKINEQL